MNKNVINSIILLNGNIFHHSQISQSNRYFTVCLTNTHFKNNSTYLYVKHILCVFIFVDRLQLPYELPRGYVATIEKYFLCVCLIRS